MKKIFVGGVYGSGKTTILRKVMGNTKNVCSFGIGEYMRTRALNEGRIKFPRDMNKLSDDDRKYFYSKAIDSVNEILKSELYDVFILDSHFSIYKGETIESTIIEDDLKKYDKMVLIESKPDEIEKRIINDRKERLSMCLSLDNIIKHIDFERNMAQYVSKRLNKEFVRLDNTELDESIKIFLELIKK